MCDFVKFKEEVIVMCEKMVDVYVLNSEIGFGLKYDCGGIVDVEFIV